MAGKVDIQEARAKLSQLVDRAAAGEEIIIARGGRPAAKLVAFRPPRAVRKPGRLRGREKISSHFDAALPGDLFKD